MTYVMPDDGRLAFKVDPIEGIAYKDRLNMQYEIFTPEPPWYALLDRDKWDQFLGGGFWEERGPA